MTRMTVTRTLRLEAECLGCSWKTAARNGHGNAARHHDRTGHTVRVEVTRLVTYGDPHQQMDGQQEMFPAATRRAA